MHEASLENKGFRKLIVWQKSDELAFQVYQVTQSFPKSEIFGIVSQMRRAALSVPANLAESSGRSSRKEKLYFCNVAKGSLTELEFFIDFSLRMNFLNEEKHKALCLLREDTGKLLHGYMKFL